jgi:undecaprenyl-diphosphatase
MRHDQGVFDALRVLQGQGVFSDTLIQLCAVYLPYALGVGFLVLIVSFKDWRLRVHFFIEALLGIILARGLITETIYFFSPTARPFATLGFEPLIRVATDASFPSGHAAVLFALATAVLFARRGWGIAYIALALIAVIARVVAGAHWPLDIVAGMAIGVGSALLVRGLLQRQYRTLTVQPPTMENEHTEEKVAEA